MTTRATRQLAVTLAGGLVLTGMLTPVAAGIALVSNGTPAPAGGRLPSTDMPAVTTVLDRDGHRIAASNDAGGTPVTDPADHPGNPVHLGDCGHGAFGGTVAAPPFFATMSKLLAGTPDVPVPGPDPAYLQPAPHPVGG